MEKIIETEVCKQCNIKFNITEKDLEFYEKISPVFGGKKYEIPTPTFCPECRQQRRLSFRNERKLYNSKCSQSGENIVSIYAPDKKLTVFNQELWHSDKWEPLDYGFDFDFDRSFFDQFSELLNTVPKMCLITNFNQDVNSTYCNYAGSNKNCYMIFDADFNEDCIYITSGFKNIRCLDCFNVHNCENCYKSIDLNKSSSCYNSINLVNCSECYNCNNCVGCNNCINCSNSHNKSYCIDNKQVTKEEYYKYTKENTDSLYKHDFINASINKYFIGDKTENVTGNYIYNSKNVFNSFEVYDSEDCKYCQGIHFGKNCYDITYFGIDSLDNCYDSNVVGVGSNNVLFSSNVVMENYNIFYSQFIYMNSSNCFGCVGLRNKQYCIFNKQYTKDQYNELVPRIIEHMKSKGERGEFFPSSLSPFGYNETVANDYFPLTKEKAINNGFNWSDYISPEPKVDKIIEANKLPDNISDILDDILNRAIKCEVTGKPFRIIRSELVFYRKHSLPIPHRHPDQRHLDRIKLRNPRKLYDRKCDKCGIEIKTTFTSDGKEKVYCEDCYNKEIY